MASSRRRPAAPRRTKTAAPPPRPRVRGAEAALLALARELQLIGAGEPSPRRALTAALERLAAAFVSDPVLVATAATPARPARRTKTAALALAWAREQVRLGLEEMFVRVDAETPRASEPSAGIRAWLTMAACEALARESREAGADHLQGLIQWALGAPA